MVLRAGLEPARPKTADFKSDVSAFHHPGILSVSAKWSVYIVALWLNSLPPEPLAVVSCQKPYWFWMSEI